MPQSVGQEPTIADSTCGTSGDLKIGGEKSKLQLSEKIGNWVDNQETDSCRMLLWRATHGDPGLWFVFAFTRKICCITCPSHIFCVRLDQTLSNII